MDIVQRLIAALLLFAFASVHAETVTIDGKTYDRVATLWLPNGDTRYSGATPAEACQNFAGAMDASCRTMDVISGPECRATCTSGFQKSWAIVRGCPSGYTITGGGDACLKEITLSPDQVCAVKAGKESIAEGVQWVIGGSTLTTKFCDAGCEARGSMAAAGGDGAVWITGPATYTGKSCATAQAEAPTEPIPNKSDNVPGTRCVMGQCPGYINGLWTCHKCSSTLTTSTSSSSSSTMNKDSTGATTGTTTTNTTTTSSTTCSGSTCTTTTTNETKNPDGTTSTTSSSSSQPKDTFCTQNPKAAACLVGAWGGSCAAGFTCDGDAVQCAIARENHKRNCELFENETADSQQGKAIANGQARPEGHPGNSPETVNVSGNIDQTNPYGGTCPPDINLSVYGKTVTIPLSNACDIFKWMGYIAVAFTMYAAARITMGGVSA